MIKHLSITKLIGIIIAVIQLFDIAIHAATNQLEPLRVASNVIILGWLVAVVSGKINEKIMQVSVGSIGAYLTLNIIFLALEGVTNPNQGGELRVILFLLVFLTATLSTLLTHLFRRDISS